jgi:hypothetical protein
MTHWLQAGGMRVSQKAEDRQWNNLQEYLSNYPESKATIYLKETGDLFCEIVKLECSQNYRDLDLYCNGGDGSLKHLNHKPNNLTLCKLQIDYYVNRKREAV